MTQKSDKNKLEVKGNLSVDLLAIYIRGIDAFGKTFDVALDNETARRLVFKLHRMILEQERMRQETAAADGGKVA